jgi:hypothetical protein
MRQRNMAMSPARPRTKNDCAGKGQQQFTQTEASRVVSRQSVVSQNLYLVTHEQRKSPMLEAATKQWLVKMQYSEKT